MTETVPRWIIYWCVHIHSQGKLNESKWRRMMSLCMVEVPIYNVVFSLRKRINISLLFLRRFWGLRPRTSSRCYYGNKSAATFKKGIFVHPPECPTVCKIWRGLKVFISQVVWFLQRLVLKVNMRKKMTQNWRNSWLLNKFSYKER